MNGARGARAWTLRAFAVACLVALTLAVGAGPASAHATLLRTDPAEGAVLQKIPDVVTFTFDESVSTTPDSIQVFDAKGDPVDSEASSRDDTVTADLPDELDDGTYVIAWRVISADSHPVAGSLTFSIGEPSLEVAAPKIDAADDGQGRELLSVAQGLSYLGLLMAGGLVFFSLWVLRDARVAEPRRRRLAKVRWGAGILALVAGALAVPLAGAYRQGIDATDVGQALDPSIVKDDLVVLGLQVVGLLVALTLVRRPRVATAAAAVAVLAPAVVGHSRAYDPVWLLVVTDAVHLSAGAVWLGGLTGLVLTLGALSGRPRDAAAVLARFSAAGAVVLGVLVATGSLMSWRILGSWSGFVDTGYGRVLLVKIGLVALVAAVAGWNRFRLLPRVEDAVGHDAQRAQVRLVRRAVAAEAGLLVCVLGLTGFLVNLSPRETPTVRKPVASRVQAAVAGDDKVLATMVPARHGRNVITVQVQDGTGEPITSFGAPAVSVRSASVDLGTVPVRATASGTYEADVLIPTAGTWEVQVSVRSSEFDNPVTKVEFTVS